MSLGGSLPREACRPRFETEPLKRRRTLHTVESYQRRLGIPADIADRGQGQMSGPKRGVGRHRDHHEHMEEMLRALELWEQQLLELYERRDASGERW